MPMDATDALETEDGIGHPITRDALERMQQWVDRGARRWRRLILLEAASLAIAQPLAYLWLVFMLDNHLHLPVWGRWAAILLFLGGVAWLCRRLVHDWMRTHFTDEHGRGTLVRLRSRTEKHAGGHAHAAARHPIAGVCRPGR